MENTRFAGLFPLCFSNSPNFGILCRMRKTITKFTLYLSVLFLLLCAAEYLITDRQSSGEPANGEQSTALDQNNNQNTSNNDAAGQENQNQIAKLSLASFLKNGIKPVGSALYVWGGGWNEEDSAAGPEGTSIGVQASWKTFLSEHQDGYDYTQYPYYIHDGLDCSGYLGWTLYNTIENENGKEGFVVNARNAGSFLSEKGWGTVTKPWEIVDYKPGDIMFNDGHVYIVLTQYDDGSLLIMHSSPPAVQINGTPALDGSTESEAAGKAYEIMNQIAPDYFNHLPASQIDMGYLNDYSQFRWNDTLFSDANQVQNMNSDQIQSLLISK